ncbi:hypothetical protein [Cellulomonas hominis]
MPTRDHVATALSVSTGTVTRLRQVGIIPSSRGLISDTEFVHLSNYRLLDPSSTIDVPWPSLIVTVRASRPDPNALLNQRTNYGWNPNLDPFHPDQLDGVTQWWPALRPQDVEVLIVTARGWVLQAYEVVSHLQQSPGFEWRFNVVPNDTDKTRRFANTRFPAQPGPKAYPIH